MSLGQYAVFALLLALLLAGALAVVTVRENRKLTREEEGLVEDVERVISRIQMMTDTAELRNLAAGERPAITEIITPANDDPCPDCRGRRCFAWRDSGHVRGCENRPGEGSDNSYVNVEDAIANPGRHTPGQTLLRWVGYDWTPLALEVRRSLAPAFWDRRLPVPRSQVLGGVA